LAGSVGLSVRLLTAWAPGQTPDDRPIYLALQLPSARSAGVEWSLEGVLRLGFRGFRFEASDRPDGTRPYLLRLQRLALSVLGWSFPPGNRDVFLFGNPNGDGSSALGWYAAYDSSVAKARPATAAVPGAAPAAPATPVRTRRLRSGRRGPLPGSGT
jgi:hypothetical protein